MSLQRRALCGCVLFHKLCLTLLFKINITLKLVFKFYYNIIILLCDPYILNKNISYSVATYRHAT